MMLTLLLIIVPILALVAYLIVSDAHKDVALYISFIAKGKDAGFLFREIRLLYGIARKVGMEEPSALFWSVRQLDQAITEYLRKSRVTGEDQSLVFQHFLSKLYAFRKKIEMEQPLKKKGIKSSRSISEGQRLRILVHGFGVTDVKVLRNTDRYLTVSRPTEKRFPDGFRWDGKKVSVYFWRRDDAGYVFDTYVLDAMESQQAASLQLAHNDSLFRTQKRRSIRAKTQISAYLYLPKESDVPERLETEPGLLCIIEDLSEDGCAVTIGGKCPLNLKVKLQFELEDEPIVMNGVVRSTEYNAEHNRSLLHIEALPLPVYTRNMILAEVFGVRPDVDQLPEDFDAGSADVRPVLDASGDQEALETPVSPLAPPEELAGATSSKESGTGMERTEEPHD